MSASNAFEQAAHDRLAREVELLKAQAAKREREFASMHMSAAQWAKVYGAPIPGASRPIGEVAAAAQLAARGRVHGASSGREITFGGKEWPA